MQAIKERRLHGWMPAAIDSRPRVRISAIVPVNPVDPERVVEVGEILEREGQKYPVICAADGKVVVGDEVVLAAHAHGWREIWAVEQEITPGMLRSAWAEERSELVVSIGAVAGKNQWVIKVVPTRERSEVICEIGPGPWEEVALESYRRAVSSFVRRRPLSVEQLSAGERLRKLRESIQLSQKEAGQICELSQNYISELENGKYSVERIQFGIDKLSRYRDMFGAA